MASWDCPARRRSVRHTPVEEEPVRLLEGAGFTGVRMVKFDAQPCFVRHGSRDAGASTRRFQAGGGKRSNNRGPLHRAI